MLQLSKVKTCCFDFYMVFKTLSTFHIYYATEYLEIEPFVLNDFKTHSIIYYNGILTRVSPMGL